MTRHQDPTHAGPPYRVCFIAQASRTYHSTTSEVLKPDLYHTPGAPHEISAAPREVYGSPTARTVLRIGNGGLGPTGLLRVLAETYLATTPDLRIEWICNHSRYTQIALQAGLVDVALTYERDQELVAQQEGWSRTVDILCHDHFVLAGPRGDPAGVRGMDIVPAMALLAAQGVYFHTRGDGSATMHKELYLWSCAGVRPQSKGWYERRPVSPLEALVGAERAGAYLLSDRGSFLLARHQGLIRGLEVVAEGDAVLLNSCAIVVRSDEKRWAVWRFVEWLRGAVAQDIVKQYGRDWERRVPLFTPREQIDVCDKDLLVQGGVATVNIDRTAKL